MSFCRFMVKDQVFVVVVFRVIERGGLPFLIQPAYYAHGLLSNDIYFPHPKSSQNMGERYQFTPNACTACTSCCF